MLATRVDTPFADPDWLYEMKWDGYRILAHKQRKNVVLHSRGLQDYTGWYRPIARELSKIQADLVLDGEIVVLNEEGIPHFDALQRYREGDAIRYYVFDLLWYNGKSLLGVTLEQRKEMLRELLPVSRLIEFSEDFDDGVKLFAEAEMRGMEGIVAKKRNSLYRPGERTRDWLKIPAVKRQEFVIGGWTESDTPRLFRSLIFGAYKTGELHFVGHSGGGWKEKEMRRILERLQKLETKNSPFVNNVDIRHRIHWAKPTLVAEFRYDTFTAGGKIRKPAIFLGFREDKNPKEVVFERTEETKNAVRSRRTSPASNWPRLEKIPVSSREDFEIDGCRIELTNVETQLWSTVHRADLIRYYNEIAPQLLPHIRGRPLSLHLKPNGPMAPGFYIKDMEGRQPECAEIFSVKRKHPQSGKNPVIDYLVCNNRATLLWMINLGCIDVNPWTSRISNYLYPDFIVIDLDPSDEDFGKAVETARAAHQIFRQEKLKAFVKTSGKTGIHLYLPCSGFDFPQARIIAENLCREIHFLVPGITTIEVSVANRGAKLYVDPNQNDEADTVAAPYSVRPFKHPTVSTPLEWKEVKAGLDPAAFTIHTIPKRIQKKGELWEGMLDPRLLQANVKGLKRYL